MSDADTMSSSPEAKEDSVPLSDDEEKIELPDSPPDNTCYNVPKWLAENENSFQPPICNKLMYGGQLKVMFVGGPNTRKDYHIECGEEFFYQMKGNMHLPIFEQGKHRDVQIKEGQVYLTFGRIPHSPQRPEKGSIGLVVERYRQKNELDCLRWFCDGSDQDKVLFERWFYCTNLGRDLVPVAEEFTKSEAHKTGKPTAESVIRTPPYELNTTKTQDPFDLKEFIATNTEELLKNKVLTVISGIETTVRIITGPFEFRGSYPVDIWVYAFKGTVKVTFEKDSKGETREAKELAEGDCLIIQPSQRYTLFIKDETSQIMTVTMKPKPPAKPDITMPL